MNKVESITAEEDGEKVYLKIIEDDGTETEIESVIQPSGTFRFSYHHPEIGKKVPYSGTFLTKNTIITYPILGLGVLTKKPIPIKRR